MFKMLAEGSIKPLRPIKVDTFENIIAAFHHVRTGTHIGKIVISNGSHSRIVVPVRPPERTLRLGDNSSYLIIDGLIGICESLALDMARCGVKYLVFISRSGYADDKSQGIVANL